MAALQHIKHDGIESTDLILRTNDGTGMHNCLKITHDRNMNR